MKTSTKGWVLGTVSVGALGWLFWHFGRPPEKSAPLAPTAHAAPSSAPAQPAPVSPPTAVAPVEEKKIAPPPARTEVEATQRMVAMHAPLREPRIADPDSTENRIILQTMLSKALAQPSRP